MNLPDVATDIEKIDEAILMAMLSNNCQVLNDLYHKRQLILERSRPKWTPDDLIMPAPKDKIIYDETEIIPYREALEAAKSGNTKVFNQKMFELFGTPVPLTLWQKIKRLL